MNQAALRRKFSVQHDTAFTATLSWTNNDDDDLTITGAQYGTYTQSDAINYGSLIDNPSRTVILLPCVQCVTAAGSDVTVVPECQITDATTSVIYVVNAADKTLKGTWWRCIVSPVGR